MMGRGLWVPPFFYAIEPGDDKQIFCKMPRDGEDHEFTLVFERKP